MSKFTRSALAKGLGGTKWDCTRFSSVDLFLLREVQASHVPKRYILGTVFQRGVGRLTNPLPAKVMANQLRIVQLKVRLEDTGRRSTKERVNGKSSGAKWFSATLAELAKT